jgi:hypothetical protein
MEWMELENICRGGEDEINANMKMDWGQEKEAISFFAQINSFDEKTVRLFLDKQISWNRPTLLAAALISELDYEIESVLYHKIIHCDNVENYSEMENLFDRLFEVMTDIFRYPECLWEVGQKASVHLEGLFLRFSFWKYEGFGTAFHNYYAKMDYRKQIAPILQWKTMEDPRYQLLDVREQELEIQWAMPTEKGEKKRAFVEKAICFYEQFFRLELLYADDELGLPRMLQHALDIEREMGEISL